MSKLISIFLLCALAMQTGFKVFIYFDYQVNKEIITQKYCENKTRPKMKCNGKCHLNKMMKEDDKSNDKQGRNPVKETTEISSFIENPKQIFINQVQEKTNLAFLYLFKKNKTPHFSFFHPPSVNDYPFEG